jgi:hypothetical protein
MSTPATVVPPPTQIVRERSADPGSSDPTDRNPKDDVAVAVNPQPSPTHAHTERKGKVALITGITGQDGSYLTELLLAKG